MDVRPGTIVGNGGVTANRYSVSFWGDENVLIEYGDSHTTLLIY